jgi:hypothetical protein
MTVEVVVELAACRRPGMTGSRSRAAIPIGLEALACSDLASRS